MKKLSIFLVAVLLIASLFVSCDNSTKAVTDEHVKVTFSVDSGSRGLGYTIEPIADSNLQWYYTAVKSDPNDPFKFGAISDKEVNLGSEITFSQGLWNFTLYAKRTDVAGQPVVYLGSSSNVLITRAESPVPIIIHVSPSTGVNGTLVLSDVSINKYAESGTLTASSVKANKAVIKNSEGTEIDTIILSDGSYTDYGLPAGDYRVVVKYYNTNGNVENASEEIFITIWSGRTTTIRGNVDELTGTGTLNKYITEDTVSTKITNEDVPKFVANVAPVNSEKSAVKNTTVVFTAGELVDTGTKTDVSLKVAVKDIETAGTTFTISGNQSAVAAISLNLTVGGEEKTGDFGDAVITTYIVKGLENVKVYYNGTSSEVKDIPNYINDSEWTTEGTPTGYSKDSGKLVFNTNHFSEYYVASNSVVALNATANTAYTTLNGAFTNADNGSTIKLLKNINEDVVIPNGKTVSLDLNGKKLTNSISHTIVNYGNLTILGTGTVDNKTHRKAALYNEVGATATLNGGLFTRSLENGQNKQDNGGNSFYAILNHGSMTINNGVSVVQNGWFSSLLENGWQNGDQAETPEAKNVVLTINGGSFTGGLNTIKNDDWGILAINGGEFTNVAQHAVLNWNVATINGGTFTSDQNPICGRSANNEMDQGKLIVTGGVFNYGSSYYGICKVEDTTQITITGGKYSNQNISNAILAEGYYSEQNEEGMYEVKKATNWIQLADTSWYCKHESCNHSDQEKNAPYTISTAKQLAGLALLVNNGNTFSDKTISLGSDIDLFGFEWTPIGAITGKSFNGNFDGCDKTISNLKIIGDVPTHDANGLFGFVSKTGNNNSSIKNINITKANISVVSNGKGGIGVAIGNVIPGCTISNIKVTNSSIVGNRWVGGIVGRGYCTIDHCVVSDISLTANQDQLNNNSWDNGDKVGGIIGYLCEMQGDPKITECEAHNVTIEGYRDLGGIVGLTQSNISSNSVTGSLNITINYQSNYKNYNADNVTAGAIFGLGNGYYSEVNSTNNTYEEDCSIDKTKFNN